METIRQYAPNEPEHGRLVEAAQELTRLSPNGTTYSVNDTWFDFGQRWMWTTIIATRPDGTSWQALNPRDHERILRSGDGEMPETIRVIKADPYWYDG